jgi:hypothetical protein
MIQADLAVPSNVVLNDLNKYTFADGVGAGEAVGYVYQQVQNFNQNRIANREVAMVMDMLCTPPDTEQVISFVNGTITWQNATEVGKPDMQHLTTAGAVVIPEQKTANVGLTWEAMRRIKSDEWIATVGRFLDGAVSAKRKSFLDAIGIATTARVHPGGTSASPSWVGGGSQNYVPPDRNGISFAADDHIDDNQADSDAGRLAAFTALRDNLWEHGYFSEAGAPIILLHGTATLADVKAVSGYTARKMEFVDYAPGGTTNYANLNMADLVAFHGVWSNGGVWCVQIGGIPDNYFYMVKSFGSRNPMNPVKEWMPADLGAQLVLKGLDLTPPEHVAPIQNFWGHLEYGFGIQDPAAGSVSLIGGGGTYTDPTNT